MAERSWEQQCQAIQNACSNSDWSQVIRECGELMQYAQQQSNGKAAAAAQNDMQHFYQSNTEQQQQQLLIQAHADQDET